MDYNALKNDLARLRQIAPADVNGVSFGYKITAGQRTPTLSVIFRVAEKKAISEIPETDRIPSTLTVAGQTYPTDVVESPRGAIKAWPACFDNQNPEHNEIARLRGQTEAGALLPLRGGQEISFVPFSNFVGNVGYIYGTIGLFAIDNEDNRVVGVTNTHVAMADVVWYGKDASRALSAEVLDAKNTLEPRFSTVDGQKYPYSATIRDKYDYHVAVRHVKRYSPLRSKPQTLLEAEESKQVNFIDAALLIMDNGKFGGTETPFVGPYSYSIRRPSDVEAAENESSTAPPYYPFATTEELDAFFSLSTEKYVYSTGRTTGPKGYCADKRLIISEVAAAIEVCYGAQNCSATPLPINAGIAPFDDVFAVTKASDADVDTTPGAPGDSGSAVIAHIPPVGASGPAVPKIIGLLFAGSADESFICRIDRVAAALNIRAWTADYNFDPETSLSIPTPRVVTESLSDGTGVIGRGTDLFVTRVENEATQKYWHAGCTIQQYYSENGPEDILLSRASIYESNQIGQYIGQFSAVDPDAEKGVIDIYQFALVPGSGGLDNASFTILSNQLRAAAVFDAETKSTYAIRVRATDSVGRFTEKSFTISILDVNDVIPANLVGVPGNGQVALSWVAPTVSGNQISLLGYDVRYSSNAGGTWTTMQITASPPAAPATTTTITNLINGTNYWFKVSAVTSAGSGPETAHIVVTPRTVPDAPTNLSVVPGGGEAVLSWLAPAQNGGAAITDYVIEHAVDSETLSWEEFTDGTSANQSAVVTDLVNGSAYLFRVAAVNAAGSGDTAETTTAVVIEPIATNVTAIANVPSTPTSVSLSWTAPTGSTQVYNYAIQYSDDDGATWTDFDDGISSATTATVTGLADPTIAYIFRVAVVDIFSTQYSFSSPSSPVIPGAPRLTYFSATILSGATAGDYAGEVVASSAVDDDTFTFALVPGTGSADNSLFEFDGAASSNSATLKVAGPITTAGTRTIRVRVTNSLNLTDEDVFQINVESP